MMGFSNRARKLKTENIDLRWELRQAEAARDEAEEARDTAFCSNDSLLLRISGLERNHDVDRGIIADTRKQRDASQRSVDSLSAELQRVRQKEVTLLRRIQRMQTLQEKLGNSLELIYTDLKLREEA